MQKLLRRRLIDIPTDTSLERGRNEYKVEVYTDEIREKEQREEQEREDAYYEEYGEEE